jgi:hypothetical protein
MAQKYGSMQLIVRDTVVAGYRARALKFHCQLHNHLASQNKSELLLCRIVNCFDGECPSILFRRATVWLRIGNFLTLNG